MKTDELIAAIAADAQGVSRPIGRTLWMAAAAGAIVAALIFFLEIGPRSDLSAALETPRFLFKYVLTLTLFISAMGLLLHIAHPGAVPTAWLFALVAAPALLIGAVIAELFLVPSPEWSHRMMGMNAFICLVLIPVLSAAPLIVLMLALRQGATTHPVLAGAAAGLVAAGIGATLYATHCTDDSALFIVIWYVLAITLVTAVGALLGPLLLRW